MDQSKACRIAICTSCKDKATGVRPGDALISALRRPLAVGKSGSLFNGINHLQDIPTFARLPATVCSAPRTREAAA